MPAKIKAKSIAGKNNCLINLLAIADAARIYMAK